MQSDRLKHRTKNYQIAEKRKGKKSRKASRFEVEILRKRRCRTESGGEILTIAEEEFVLCCSCSACIYICSRGCSVGLYTRLFLSMMGLYFVVKKKRPSVANYSYLSLPGPERRWEISSCLWSQSNRLTSSEHRTRDLPHLFVYWGTAVCALITGPLGLPGRWRGWTTVAWHQLFYFFKKIKDKNPKFDNGYIGALHIKIDDHYNFD